LANELAVIAKTLVLSLPIPNKILCVTVCVRASRCKAKEPKAPEHQTDTQGNQCGPDRSIPDNLDCPALSLVHFAYSMFVIPRGIRTQFMEVLAYAIPGNAVHFVEVFRHFPRLFAKPITCGSHAYYFP